MIMLIRQLLYKIKNLLKFQKRYRVKTNALKAKDEFIRLGTHYGGWYIPLDFTLTDQDVCYLVGAGEDISFDCELVKRYPCQVCIFDPTPRAKEHFDQLFNAVSHGNNYPINNTDESYNISMADFQRVSFYPWGVAGSNQEMKFFFCLKILRMFRVPL